MRVILIVLLAIGLLVSCGGNGDNEGGNGGGGTGWMKAKINGDSWQSNVWAMCLVYEQPNLITIVGTRRVIADGETTTSSITLPFDNHEIDEPETLSYIYYDPQGRGYPAQYFKCDSQDPSCWYFTASENPGKLIITRWGGIGGRAKGTFSFTAHNVSEDSVVVTNGEFEVPIVAGHP